MKQADNLPNPTLPCQVQTVESQKESTFILLVCFFGVFVGCWFLQFVLMIGYTLFFNKHDPGWIITNFFTYIIYIIIIQIPAILITIFSSGPARRGKPYFIMASMIQPAAINVLIFGPGVDLFEIFIFLSTWCFPLFLILKDDITS